MPQLGESMAEATIVAIKVKPGEKVATDGVVEDGASAIDASLLTGDSVPVEVGPGEPVTGATLNACARVLLDAGASEVRALTAARAVVRAAASR